MDIVIPDQYPFKPPKVGVSFSAKVWILNPFIPVKI